MFKASIAGTQTGFGKWMSLSFGGRFIVLWKMADITDLRQLVNLWRIMAKREMLKLKTKVE